MDQEYDIGNQKTKIWYPSWEKCKNNSDKHLHSFWEIMKQFVKKNNTAQVTHKGKKWYKVGKDTLIDHFKELNFSTKKKDPPTSLDDYVAWFKGVQKAEKKMKILILMENHSVSMYQG